MPNPDWYPKRLADLPPWHTHFAAQAVVTGVADGLSAGQVTRITTNADSVVKLINYRLQGMIANARVGDVSPVLSIVTLP